MRARLLEVIEKHWGYNSFRPLQEEAMTAVLSGRDSVVVMPTGGGKSLCYQVPALLREGVTVVVSPLISLMKDQVDALRACGVPATQMNSSQSALELRALEKDLFDGKIRIVFVSPERLAMPGFRQTLQKAGVIGEGVETTLAQLLAQRIDVLAADAVDDACLATMALEHFDELLQFVYAG